MDHSLWRYAKTFGETVFLEAPIVLPWLVRVYRRVPRAVLGLVAVNLATHPIVYFVFPWVGDRMGWRFGDMLLMSEGFAIGLEAVLLSAIGRNIATGAALALVANLFSWWVGALL